APGIRVAGQHVALVDDVLTTGATAHGLARLLINAGARQVDVYCLARTPKPGS
ncbi:ComF family protein, partial [Pseudomonas lactis]